MINERDFPTGFYDPYTMSWRCPNCGSRSLECKENQFSKYEKDNFNHKDPYFDPDWIKYVFTMNLECSIKSCGCHVVCIGTGDVSMEYVDDSGGSGYVESFYVTYFQPPLQIFTPPKKTPYWVREALTTSFSTFFSSPSTSLSTLRTALEVLLREMKVPSRGSKGGFLPLAARINQLPKQFQEIIEPANAIRWLGNDGTHFGDIVRQTDVLNGYRIFENILNQLFPNEESSIEELVQNINKNKGIEK